MLRYMPPKNIISKKLHRSISNGKFRRAMNGLATPRRTTIILHENARARFDIGPISETSISSCRKLEKFIGFTGTGFAHAIKTCPAINNEKRGTMIDPIRSICGIGLNVKRPASRAVGSPSRSAIHP
jgi:hypothetical protein